LFHISDIESHGAWTGGREMGRSEPRLADGACWGPVVEMCGAPEVVQTGRARPVILVPAPESCPRGERRGFKGRSVRGRRRAQGGGAASRLVEREEGVRRKERREVTFLWACMTEEARASGRVLLFGRPGTSILEKKSC
jgi:hypothetical protein